MDENANVGHKYYFALMLRDSANHLPTIIDNLLRVIFHLGEQNIFFSVYEGGSSDDGHTTAMVETIKITLEAIGIEHSIEVDGMSTGNPRDKVLKPLKEMYKANGRVFNTVVMMGDDLWCAEELLELVFHSRGQAASITCSTDVRVDVTPPPLFTSLILGR
jgi:alpha-1,3-mannosyltransferase